MVDLVLLDFGRAVGAHDPDTGRLWRLKAEMTTDPEEGRRQIEAMQPPALKVGDKVRLAAGGPDVPVLAVEDDGDVIVVGDYASDGAMLADMPERHSRRSLVRVD